MAGEPKAVRARPSFGLFAAARRTLREDAVGRWEVSGAAAEILFALPLVGTVVLAAATLHHPLYVFVVAEDSVLEWLQVLGFALGAVLSFAVARRYQQSGDGVAVLFFLLAAGCVFLAGEEISWGQRLFGFGTPESLRDVNAEDETNVHNVPILRIGLKFLAIAVGLAAAAFPWLVRGESRGYRALVPPLFVTSAFLVVAGYNTGRLVFFTEGFFGGTDHFTVARFSEWTEVCLAYAFAVFAFVSLRALGPRCQGALPAP